MKLEQVIKESDCSTGSADVKGIPQRMMPVVRRKLPVKPTNIVVYAKKKKKKKRVK